MSDRIPESVRAAQKALRVTPRLKDLVAAFGEKGLSFEKRPDGGTDFVYKIRDKTSDRRQILGFSEMMGPSLRLEAEAGLAEDAKRPKVTMVDKRGRERPVDERHAALLERSSGLRPVRRRRALLRGRAPYERGYARIRWPSRGE